MDGTLTFNVGRPRFQANDVFLIQLQLGCILNSHDSFAVGNKRGQNIEQRRLTGAGAA